MAVQFAVLASGSRGNATFLGGGGAGLLIDLGLTQKGMAERLRAAGAGWDRVGAALLTHTHSDHVEPAALAELARRGVSLHCHSGHRAVLAGCAGFQELERAGRVRPYDDEPFLTATGARVEPIRLAHDGGPTYGFRIEIRDSNRGPATRIGYLADTGCWTASMVDRLVDVDLLAVEFNHDVELQRTADRPARLIKRNLGDRGHLSNNQAGDLVRSVVERSRPGRPRDVVLLHLSEQCNTPELALEAARAAAGPERHVHAACQAGPHPCLRIEAATRTPQRSARPAIARRKSHRTTHSPFITGLLFDHERPAEPTTVEIA